MRGLLLVLALTVRVAAQDPAPGDLDALLRRGSQAYRNGRYDEALEAMTRALEIDPRNATVRNYIWTTVKKIEEQDASIALSPSEKRQAVGLASRELDARRANARQALGKLRRAYDASRSLKSPEAMLAETAGLERFLDAKFESERARLQAQAYFDGVLDRLKKDIEGRAYVSRKDERVAEGFAAYYNRRWDEAASRWDEALKEDPKDERLRQDLERVKALAREAKREETVRALVRQAQTYEQAGYPKDAVESWTLAARLDPSYRERLEAARQALAKSERQEQLRLKTGEGLKLYRNARYLDAAQLWLEALQIDPSYKQARDLLAMVGEKLQAQRQPTLKPAAPVAQETGRRARAADADLAAQLYRDGILLYSQGKIQDAITAWNQALVADPSMAKARQSIERARAELNFYEAGSSHL